MTHQEKIHKLHKATIQLTTILKKINRNNIEMKDLNKRASKYESIIKENYGVDLLEDDYYPDRIMAFAVNGEFGAKQELMLIEMLRPDKVLKVSKK